MSPQVIVGLIAVVMFALVAVGCGSSTKRSHGVNIDVTLRQALRDHAAGKLGTAKKEYEEVLAEDGPNKYARYNLGLIAQTEGDTQEQRRSTPQPWTAVPAEPRCRRRTGRARQGGHLGSVAAEPTSGIGAVVEEPAAPTTTVRR